MKCKTGFRLPFLIVPVVLLSLAAFGESPVADLRATISEADKANNAQDTIQLAGELLSHAQASDKDRVWARNMILRGTRKLEGATVDQVIEAANALVNEKGSAPDDAIVAYIEVGQFAQKMLVFDVSVEWLKKAVDTFAAKDRWMMWGGDAIAVATSEVASSQSGLKDKAGAAETALDALEKMEAHGVPLRFYFQQRFLSFLQGFGPEKADKELRGQAIALKLQSRVKKSKDILQTFDRVVDYSAYGKEGVSAETKQLFLGALDGLAEAAAASEKTEDVDPAALVEKIKAWKASLPTP
ncbi:MAG: hypothetical protein V2A58_03150 [Planctomycetota bacterium]